MATSAACGAWREHDGNNAHTHCDGTVHLPAPENVCDCPCHPVLQAYIVCALWSSTILAGEHEDEPMDGHYGADDVSFGSVVNMHHDVADFLALCRRENVDLSALDNAQIGHDFWLTRNHHGAGFWDRGLGELGDKLTELAHSYGEASLWDGEDGRIYYQTA